MPSIMRNNIRYSSSFGGGSGGGEGREIVELTQAEYDALGDVVNTNGVLYAITDGEDLTAKNIPYDGSVTGLGDTVQSAIDNSYHQVRYNKETDIVELFHEGKWQEWKSGNLQTYEELIPVAGGSLTASSEYDSDSLITNILEDGASTCWWSNANDNNAEVTYVFPHQVLINNLYLNTYEAVTDTNIEIQISNDLINYEPIASFLYSDKYEHISYLENVKCRGFKIKFLTYNYYSSSGYYCTISNLKLRGRVIEEFTNGNIDSGNLIKYTTEEAIIGTWIDGRPIYRKTYTGTFTSGSNSAPLESISNIDCIIQCSGFMINNGMSWDVRNSQTGVYVRVIQNAIITVGFEQALDSNIDYGITVEYLKTS